MHTTRFKVGGRQFWMIHDGDFSGEVIVRWSISGAPPESVKMEDVGEVKLPSGVFKEMVVAFLTVTLPGHVETLINSDAGQRFLERVLFR